MAFALGVHRVVQIELWWSSNPIWEREKKINFSGTYVHLNWVNSDHNYELMNWFIVGKCFYLSVSIFRTYWWNVWSNGRPNATKHRWIFLSVIFVSRSNISNKLCNSCSQSSALIFSLLSIYLQWNVKNKLKSTQKYWKFSRVSSKTARVSQMQRVFSVFGWRINLHFNSHEMSTQLLWQWCWWRHLSRVYFTHYTRLIGRIHSILFIDTSNRDINLDFNPRIMVWHKIVLWALSARRMFDLVLDCFWRFIKICLVDLHSSRTYRFFEYKHMEIGIKIWNLAAAIVSKVLFSNYFLRYYSNYKINPLHSYISMYSRFKSIIAQNLIKIGILLQVLAIAKCWKISSKS